MLEEPSPHLLCSPHILFSDSGDYLGRLVQRAEKTSASALQVPQLLFRIHMMSRGVFGATVWPVQYVQYVLYSCLEYLGQACCSTCLCHLMQSCSTTAASPSWPRLGCPL